MENAPFQDVFPIVKMEIFHFYVSLPERIYTYIFIIIHAFFIRFATRPVQRAQRPDFGPDGQAEIFQPAASLVAMICIFLGMKNHPSIITMTSTMGYPVIYGINYHQQWDKRPSTTVV